jgi:hypothetical protein
MQDKKKEAPDSEASFQEFKTILLLYGIRDHLIEKSQLLFHRGYPVGRLGTGFEKYPSLVFDPVEEIK